MESPAEKHRTRVSRGTECLSDCDPFVQLMCLDGDAQPHGPSTSPPAPFSPCSKGLRACCCHTYPSARTSTTVSTPAFLNTTPSHHHRQINPCLPRIVLSSQPMNYLCPYQSIALGARAAYCTFTPYAAAEMKQAGALSPIWRARRESFGHTSHLHDNCSMGECEAIARACFGVFNPLPFPRSREP